MLHKIENWLKEHLALSMSITKFMNLLEEIKHNIEKIEVNDSCWIYLKGGIEISVLDDDVEQSLDLIFIKLPNYIPCFKDELNLQILSLINGQGLEYFECCTPAFANVLTKMPRKTKQDLVDLFINMENIDIHPFLYMESGIVACDYTTKTMEIIMNFEFYNGFDNFDNLIIQYNNIIKAISSNQMIERLTDG